jgi:hypothetical protein
MISAYNPAATLSPYPRVTTTPNAIKLAGIPLVRKCFTLKYRCPASFSIMIAAVIN